MWNLSKNETKATERENQYYSEVNDERIFSFRSNEIINDENITIKSIDHYLDKRPMTARTHVHNDKITTGRSYVRPVSGVKYNSQKTIEQIHIFRSNSPSERDILGQSYTRYIQIVDFI